MLFGCLVINMCRCQAFSFVVVVSCEHSCTGWAFSFNSPFLSRKILFFSCFFSSKNYNILCVFFLNISVLFKETIIFNVYLSQWAKYIYVHSFHLKSCMSMNNKTNCFTCVNRKDIYIFTWNFMSFFFLSQQEKWNVFILFFFAKKKLSKTKQI